MKTDPIRFPTPKYALMNAFYWIAICSASCFVSNYMLPKGYSNAIIGATVAASNICSLILQPAVASAIDRSRHITLRGVLIVFSLIAALFSLLLVFVPSGTMLLPVVVVLSIIFLSATQPFVNAVSVALTNNGYNVSFGLCRAFGSLGYAFASLVIGFLCTRFSENAIPFNSILVCLGLMLSSVILANPDRSPAQATDTGAQTEGCAALKDGAGSREAETADSDAEIVGSASEMRVAGAGPDEATASSLGAFLLSNRRFLLFLVATVLLFTSHCVTSYFLYQITCSVGGGSSEMGTASAIAAVLELPVMMLFSVMVRKIKCHKLLIISGIAFAVRFVAFFLANSVFTLYLAEVPQMLAFGLFIPASVYYVGKLFSKADMAKAQALITAATTAGVVVANLAGGKLIDMLGIHYLLGLCCILGLAGMILMFFSVENVDKDGDTGIRAA